MKFSYRISGLSFENRGSKPFSTKVSRVLLIAKDCTLYVSMQPSYYISFIMIWLGPKLTFLRKVRQRMLE